ncbi:polysaccharide biosynthesis protein [Solirubrobacter phytolaccae]|uniref:Polysaccharide biosynthesis protein n=1 Tax=Solirubrobacter phytolaccae TaxID=1404360 RepID=A0A9X3NBV0_9ACTN|nr:nucleoside-diphosphate sugar epimerase/dehydratase [Solirubrobacter phytolaccae]MDA0183518.1 polysaccharide biosynthesis protein [Solirubrobacter phytolaccae]
MRRRLRTAAFPIHRHSVPQVVLDAGLVALAYYLAYSLRFDGELPSRYSDLLWRTITFAIFGSLFCFAIVGMYRHWMRYSSQREYLKIAEGTVLAVLVLVGYVAIVQPVMLTSTPDGLRPLSIPASVLVLYGLLLGALLTGSRFVAHLIFMRGISGWRTRRDGRKVLIVGAGDGGHLLYAELRKNPDLGYRPIGYVDDNKKGSDILGTTFELDEVLEDVEPDEVMIAIPSASGELRGRVVRACREQGVPVRTVPTVFELLQGGNHLTRQLREVRVEDVLGRNPVRMEIESVGNYLRDQRVLVTGAGGSIGSEICRQIARVNPSRLVLVDHSEANLFEIERELVGERHVLTSVSVLADVKDEERMREVFAEHQPEIVFHAAAYKHVGLMESNPIEAVRNNALATRALTTVAGEAGVQTFVLISTDKAVAPATVMGASKALAEWAMEAANTHFPETSFCAVRFGNVLGSSGSVVPIFRRQIAAGGPLTVTDPEMTRFFMTIPEAVQLVIRSGSLSNGGEVYALDMGEPVSIMGLAKQMVEFSGLQVGRDIGIEIVGRRPGEKLHEQLFNSYETPEPTPAEKIRRAARPAVDPAWVDYVFDKVALLVAEGDAAALAVAVAELSTGRATPAEPSGGTAS